jgi:phospholipase/lecithinase/hemolysin
MQEHLESDGAKTLLLYNVPDLGLTPFIQELAIADDDPALPGQAPALRQEFNTLVSQDLAKVDPGLSVHTLDSFDLIVNATMNPGDFGLTDVTNPCWSGGATGFAGGGTVCSSPDTYLFWDFGHPTALANEFVAEAAFQALILEPSTWAMMLIGLAGLGFAGARRARVTAPTTGARAPQTVLTPPEPWPWRARHGSTAAPEDQHAPVGAQSTVGVIAEASMVPPNPEVVTVTFSPAFMRLMLTPRATL